ncbi:sigma-70 family RNA polymerase sigma factor [Gemmata sp. JC673]|uniref:Sigma-70 family RNA polymerase sigma factor n=1 Tax=Gemmata algarum TaxID=2975278 RepID=A0ABU5F7H3_9BACT|nr:sigma-70 family RNA polymerase sigma factor [Gemmata algarum]MDY3563281.1 sigma-70 family RNA polymerase sigma factor [Gemmata algarum]
MRTVAALCRELLPDRRSDGELLAAFTSERNEPAFQELVRRHGPLVWNTCRRLLPHTADAEDAFQAVFLVLASQGRKLAARETVGPWLYRVAVLTSRNLRRKNARRLARQRELPETASAGAPDSDLRADIDGALLALPERDREPIILCHLQGFTRQEAAARLGCPEGTLSARLNRGLAKLRVRLRAFDPVQALAVPAVAVPAALATNTVHAAVASGAAVAAVTPVVSSLVQGVLHMFWVQKATAASFAMCAVFVVGVGVGLGTRPVQTGVVAQDGTGAGAAAKPAKNAPPPGAENPTDEITALERKIQAIEQQQKSRRHAYELTIQKLKEAKQSGESLAYDSKDVQAVLQLSREIEDIDRELHKSGGLKDKWRQLKWDLARKENDGPPEQGADRQAPRTRNMDDEAQAIADIIREEMVQLRLKDLKLKESTLKRSIDIKREILQGIQQQPSKSTDKAAAAAEKLAQAKPLVQELQEAIFSLQQTQEEIANAEAELKAQPKLTKAKEQKPAPAAEIDAPRSKADDLRAQLARLEAEKALVLKQAELAKLQLDTTEEQLRRLKEAIAQADRAANRKRDGGSYLELTVGGTDNTFVIREVRTEVKGQATAPLGPITTSDPAALALLLARAKNDPSGPKSVEIKVTDKANRESERAAREACKGFENIRVTGPTGAQVPTKPPVPDDQRKPVPRQPVKPAPGATNKANIDELIKGLKLKGTELDKLDKLNKAELDTLRKRIEEELKTKPAPTKP